MKNTKEVNLLKGKMFFFLGLINLVIIACTYVILPVILNYPPYAENDIVFQNDVENLNHPMQYLILFVLTTFIFTLITNFLMQNIYTYLNHYYRKEPIKDNEIQKVRKDCLNIPYIFYISEIIMTFIISFILVFALGISSITSIYSKES